MIDEDKRRCRVLVFGATGVGKTSLCNSLTGRSRPTGSGARGVTAKSHLYGAFPVGDVCVELIDTVGLNESDEGTVPAEQAILELIHLLENSKDGFNLLVHVVRATRVTKQQDADYKFFVERMTLNKIPVILAVTGCDNEVPMSGWVDKNSAAFQKYSYKNIIATCFAAGGALEQHYSPLREESRMAMTESIVAHAAPEPILVYGETTGRSFNELLTRLWNDFVDLAGLPERYRRKLNESVYGLLRRLGVPQDLAELAIKHIPDVVEGIGAKSPIPFAGKALRKASEVILEKLMRLPKG